MTPLRMLALQWAITFGALAVQGYLIYRAWRNWVQSARDVHDAAENMRRTRVILDDLRRYEAFTLAQSQNGAASDDAPVQ